MNPVLLNRTLFTTVKLTKEDAAKTSKPKQQPEQPKPAAKNAYQNQEYFGYDQYSYFDLELDMVKHRLPQPSALPKIEYTYSKLPPKEFR